jgi:hypothetical protein
MGSTCGCYVAPLSRLSGCASEVAFAVGIGKSVFRLRTDWRDSGEFALPLNPQVLHFIEKSGGRLFRSIEEIEF